MKTMMISTFLMTLVCVTLAACGGSSGKPADNSKKSGGGGGDDIMRLPVPAEIAEKEPPTSLDDADFIAMGKKIFEDPADGNCVSCHGESGTGDGLLAAQYTDPIVSDLTATAFHDAVTDQYIYWRMTDISGSKAYPNSGMLGYAVVAGDGKITDEEAKKVWAVVAYVRSLKGK